MFKQEFNFFPRLDFILPEIKKINLYNLNDHNKKTNLKATWPGARSLPLHETNVFLFEYINYLLVTKKFISPGSYEIKSYIHLRLKVDDNKDWIHKDSHDLSALIYLSNTNYNSGTYFYDDDENIVNDIKFIKNSCILFPGNFNHKGYGHHGETLENGRLTLNLFIDKR